MLPEQVVIGVHHKLAHHGRIVVRGDASIGQAPHRSLGQAAPLRVAEPAKRFVDLAQEGLECSHGVKGRGLTGIGADTLDGRWRQLGGIVVEHQTENAVAQAGLGQSAGTQGANRPAHGGANPVHGPQFQRVHQLAGQLRIKPQAILLIGIATPLRQAPTHGVRTNHPPTPLGQAGGQFIHVAAGPRQSMPGHDRAFFGAAPVGVMDFQTGAVDITGRTVHGALPALAGLRAACTRSRPTTPVGK